MIEGTDLLVVRELTGGIYFGDKGARRTAAPTTSASTPTAEIERIARVALPRRALARDQRRQGERARDVAAVARGRRAACTREEFPNVELEHLLVDNAAMQLVAAPRHFDVIVTENMFGDILSDEAAMLTGSIGMLPERVSSASGGPGVFEPVHGSAPDIAGAGDRQPAGDDPLGGADAAPRTRPGGRRRLP